MDSSPEFSGPLLQFVREQTGSHDIEPRLGHLVPNTAKCVQQVVEPFLLRQTADEQEFHRRRAARFAFKMPAHRIGIVCVGKRCGLAVGDYSLFFDAVTCDVILAPGSVAKNTVAAAKEKEFSPLLPTIFLAIISGRVAEHCTLTPQQNAQDEHHPVLGFVVAGDYDKLTAIPQHVGSQCKHQFVSWNVVMGSPKQQFERILMIRTIHTAELRALDRSLGHLNEFSA